jgi:protein-tyrosine phosphatase
MRIFWINEFKKGNLGMMARPKGNDWLEDEIKKLGFYEVDVVVSLLEWHEMKELEIESEQLFCEKHDIEFIHFPIQDRNVPEDEKAFIQLITTIDLKLKEGKKIVIHCRMGIGRTAVIAAGTLIKNGLKADNVFELLSNKRTLEVPDTNEQVEWIERMNAQIIS